MGVTPDAAYEAAAKAWHERKFYESWDTETSDAAKDAARVAVHPIVDAAAGHLRAQALRDAAPVTNCKDDWALLRDRADAETTN